MRDLITIEYHYIINERKLQITNHLFLLSFFQVVVWVAVEKMFYSDRLRDKYMSRNFNNHATF